MKKKKLFYGWWVVIGCMMIMGPIVPISIPLATMYLPPIAAEFGISRSSFLLINTLMQALGIVLSPIIAKKMAKGQVRKFLIIGILGFVTTYFINSFAHNIYFLYVTGIFKGLFFFMSTGIPVNMLVIKWFVAKRGLATSLSFAGVGMGGFIFSPVVSFFLENFGWRMTYRLIALLVLAIALPAALFLIKDKPADKNLQALDFEDGINLDKKPQASGIYVPFTAKEAVKKAFFVFILMGLFLSTFVAAGSSTHFAPALIEFHSAAHQASVLSLFLITGVIGKLLMGWIVDRFGLTISILFGGGMFVASMFFLMFSHQLIFAYLMALAFGLGSGFGPVLPPIMMAKIFPPEEYPIAFGFGSSFIQFGLTFGALAVAFLYDFYGNYGLAWRVFFFLSILTLATYLIGWQGAKRNMTAPEKAIVE